MTAERVLARAVCEAYARNCGNDFKDHFDTRAAIIWMQQALEEVGVAELIEAASHRVANSFEEARDMDDRKENPIWCEVDMLNPCWVIGRPITTPLRHWGWTPGDVGDGWNACPQCRLRAALARVGAP